MVVSTFFAFQSRFWRSDLDFSSFHWYNEVCTWGGFFSWCVGAFSWGFLCWSSNIWVPCMLPIKNFQIFCSFHVLPPCRFHHINHDAIFIDMIVFICVKELWPRVFFVDWVTYRSLASCHPSFSKYFSFFRDFVLLVFLIFLCMGALGGKSSFICVKEVCHRVFFADWVTYWSFAWCNLLFLKYFAFLHELTLLFLCMMCLGRWMPWAVNALGGDCVGGDCLGRWMRRGWLPCELTD